MADENIDAQNAQESDHALADEAPREAAASESNDSSAQLDAQPVEIKRKRTVAPVRKSAPTPKRRDGRAEEPQKKKRTTPVMFARQSVGELKQVKWPSAQMVRQYFWVVLVFVLFIMLIVSGLDWLFGWIGLKALG